MEFIELLTWLAEQNSKTESQEQLEAVAKQVSRNQAEIELLSGYADSILRASEICFILSLVAIVIMYFIIKHEYSKKSKLLESRIIELEKNIQNS